MRTIIVLTVALLLNAPSMACAIERGTTERLENRSSVEKSLSDRSPTSDAPRAAANNKKAARALKALLLSGLTYGLSKTSVSSVQFGARVSGDRHPELRAELTYIFK